MFNERLLMLLQQIKELLMSKRFYFEEEHINNSINLKNRKNLHIQILRMVDELLDIFKKGDEYFDYSKSRYNIFEYFFEKTEIIFHDLKKEHSYKNFLELYNQIEQIYIFYLSRINNSLVDKQLYKMQDNISNVQKAIDSLTKLDYVKETKKSKALLKYLEKKQKEADDILGNLAEGSNAKKYEDFAKVNKWSARFLFWASIGIMAFVAFHCFNILWDIMVIDSKILIWKFPILLLILMPSFFIMRESKKLKDKQFQYYDMACRIKTSEPYIEGLSISPEEKGKLKADLVKDFFARPIECRDDGGVAPMSEFAKIIKDCADFKDLKNKI